MVYDTTTCLQVGSSIIETGNTHSFTKLAISGDGTTLIAIERISGYSVLNAFHFDGLDWVRDPHMPETQVYSATYLGGVEVSDDGNTIAYIGVNPSGTYSSSGYRVIRWDGGAWVPVGNEIATQAREITMNAMGDIIAGVDYDTDSASPNTLRGRVFEYTGGEWSQRGSDIDMSIGDPHQTKIALSADGQSVATSWPKSSQEGWIRVYSFGTDWYQVGNDIAANTDSSQNSGARLAVSADGSIVAFAADSPETDDDSWADSFHVYFNNGGSWVPATLPAEALGPKAGYWVGLSDDGRTVASSSEGVILIFTLPTMSPTVSPTASPTSPCSTLIQRLTISETDHSCPQSTEGSSPHTCDAGDKSTVKANDHYNRHFEDVVMDALQAQFGEAPFVIADLVKLFDTDGVWASTEATSRMHHVVLEYRPKSPVSHIELGLAGTSLQGTPFGVTYCGCQSTLTVTASSYEYQMVEERGSSAVATPGGKCPGEYKNNAKQGKRNKKNTKSGKNPSASALGAGGAIQQASVGVVACGLLAIVATVATGAVRRSRRSQSYNTISTDAPIVVVETSSLLG